MSSLSDSPDINIPLVIKLSLASFPQNQIVGQLTAAQAILESRLEGTPSELAMKYCNLFGQKPGKVVSRGTKGIVYLPTKEYTENGDVITTQAGFLWNNTIEDSIAQHCQLLTMLYRYSNLFQCQTFEQAANYIRLDGYATDPDYSKSLIQIFEDYINVNKNK